MPKHEIRTKKYYFPSQNQNNISHIHRFLKTVWKMAANPTPDDVYQLRARSCRVMPCHTLTRFIVPLLFAIPFNRFGTLPGPGSSISFFAGPIHRLRISNAYSHPLLECFNKSGLLEIRSLNHGGSFRSPPYLLASKKILNTPCLPQIHRCCKIPTNSCTQVLNI